MTPLEVMVTPVPGSPEILGDLDILGVPGTELFGLAESPGKPYNLAELTLMSLQVRYIVLIEL